MHKEFMKRYASVLCMLLLAVGCFSLAAQGAELVPAQGANISGVVKAPANSTGSVSKPVAGAAVELYLTATASVAESSAMPGTWTATTNSAGEFGFRNLRAGQYKLIIKAAGYVVLQQSVSLIAGQSLALALTLQPIKVSTGAILTGTVTNANSQAPIARACIVLNPALQAALLPQPLPTAQTNAAGVYRIEGLRGGLYHVAVRAEGFTPLQRDVEVTTGQLTLANFALVPMNSTTSGDVTGHVRDAATSVPLEGVRVHFHRLPAQPVVLDARVREKQRSAQLPPETSDYVVTAADGSYAIDEIPVGPYQLAAETRYYCPQVKLVTVTSTQTAVADFALKARVQGNGNLLGTVYTLVQPTSSTATTDGATTVPVAGARVRVTVLGDLSTLAGQTPGVVYGETVTDAQGHYEIDAIPAGPRQVVATLDGYRPTQRGVYIEPNANTTANLLLLPIPVRAKGALSGTAYDSATSAPLAGVEVSLQPRGKQIHTLSQAPNEALRAVTGDDGAYAFASLAVGTYDVRFAKSGYRPARKTAAITAEATTVCDASLSPRIQPQLGWVTGHVVSTTSNSLPLAGVVIHAMPDSAAQLKPHSVPDAVTDTQGAYQLALPEGTYRVVAVKAGFNTGLQSATVTANAATVADFALTPIAGYGAVEGDVTDALTSTPLAGVRLALTLNGAAPASDLNKPFALTDAAGHYRIEHVPEGARYVLAVKAGYWADTRGVAVEVGQTATLNFELLPREEAETTVTVQVLNDHGKQINAARVRIAVLDQLAAGDGLDPWIAATDMSGRAKITRVPQGTWVVQASADGCLAQSAELTTTAKSSAITYTIILKTDETQNAVRNWMMFE
jgi:5-hydroxyisourate hydrolase-like protein (transthyretin family)